MRIRNCTFGVLCLVGLLACDGGSGADAGTSHDAARADAGRDEDGGLPPDRECLVDTDCGPTLNACAANLCQLGQCIVGPTDECEGCVLDVLCDDGNPCTGDTCVAGVCRNEDTPGCSSCTSDAACDDENPCTDDRCGSDGECRYEVREECACIDGDGDGAPGRSSLCPSGTDCNDDDDDVHPGAAEVCANSVDDNCDGDVDLADATCAMAGGTCSDAIPLSTGTFEGAVPLIDVARPACGTSRFYAMTLTEVSDVDLSLILLPMPREGHSPFYDFRIYLEAACGDPETDVSGARVGCFHYEPGSSFGSDRQSLSVRRLAPGNYFVEVQAGEFAPSEPGALLYRLEAAISPSDAPACDTATELGEGVPLRADTRSGVDAYGHTCDGRVEAAEENVHRFTLTERRRVRLAARADNRPGTDRASALRVGLRASCDAEADTIACMEHAGGPCRAETTLEAVLDAGTYFAAVESPPLGAEYTVTLDTEEPTAACDGAPALGSSASGSTTGAPDRFRDSTVCGGGYGPDRVFRLDVPSRSRVVLDLIAGYDDALVRLLRGCGAEVLEAGDAARIDTVVDAGVYEVVVDGQEPEDHGSFVLNATLVPTSD